MEREPDPRASAPRRVEAYLDQILAPLARRLSPFHRDELRRELRGHLWARVDAYREQGQSENEAVTEALRQFGGAEDFLQEWHQEWKLLSNQLTLRTICEAGRSALGPSLKSILAINLLYLAVQECIWHLPESPAVIWANSHPAALGWSMAGTAFLVLPTLLGARYGRQTSERAGVGMVAALTAQIVITSLLWGAVTLASDSRNSTGITDMLFKFLLGMMAGWIPIAGGAAAVSGWWTRRQETDAATAAPAGASD